MYCQTTVPAKSKAKKTNWKKNQIKFDRILKSHTKRCFSWFLSQAQYPSEWSTAKFKTRVGGCQDCVDNKKFGVHSSNLVDPVDVMPQTIGFFLSEIENPRW